MILLDGRDDILAPTVIAMAAPHTRCRWLLALGHGKAADGWLICQAISLMISLFEKERRHATPRYGPRPPQRSWLALLPMTRAPQAAHGRGRFTAAGNALFSRQCRRRRRPRRAAHGLITLRWLIIFGC